MAVMLDTEGIEIPCDYKGDPLFDIDLWNDEEGPHLLVNIPVYFESGKAGQDCSVYEGDGVLMVDFREVLEEYLQTKGSKDGFYGAGDFASYLRDYADRLEAAAEKCEYDR